MSSHFKPAGWLKEQKALGGHLSRGAILLSVLSGWVLILQSGLLAWILNAVVIDHKTVDDLLTLILFLPVLFLLRAVLNIFAERLAFRTGSRIREQLRLEFMAHLQKLGPMRLSRNNSAEISNALLDGIEALQEYFGRYLPHLGVMTLVPLSILIAVLPLDWISALVFLVTAPLIPFFMILIGKGAERVNQRQWQKLARLGAYFLDVLRGLTTLKTLNISRQEAQFVASMSDDYRRSTLAVLKVAFLSSLVLEFLSTVSIAMIAVFIGFRLMWGEMSYLHGFFILLLAPEFYLPLRTMGTHYHARLKAVAAAEQLLELLAIEPPESKEVTEVLSYSGQVDVAFEHVSYRYGDDKAALLDIDLRIAPGETVALVGPSGSGKTTLVNLLLGFDRPASGDIFINQINLASVSNDDWLRHVAWVPQNPRLIHGSVAENIALGQVDPDPSRLSEAARLARAGRFIEALGNGYDTLIGEGGHPLSGGEIQRIALARAFYKRAPLVILDEPTAGLDAESEQAVSAAMEALGEDRSLLIIAHRLQTVRNADRIYVLKHGRIVEQGGHEELLDRQGDYAALLQGVAHA